MAAVICKNGKIKLLDTMLKVALLSDESLTLKLYRTNVTPTNTSVAGDFTECNFTNYVAKTLTRTGWGSAAEVGSYILSTYGTPQSWTCGASTNTVYGAYIVDSDGDLVWAEKFTSSIVLTNGASFNYRPYVQVPV